MFSLFPLFVLFYILIGYDIGLICDIIIPATDEIKSYGNEDIPFKK